jgi:hypothetical protein
MDAVSDAPEIAQPAVTARQRAVVPGLRLGGKDVDPVQVAELLREVVAAGNVGVEGLRVLGPGVAPDGRWDDWEGLVGALLAELRADVGDVGNARRASGAVLAVAHVIDVGEEHRCGPDHGDVVAARLDLRVGGRVRVELRVVEVDHELATGRICRALRSWS